MNARSSSLAPDRRLGKDPAQVHVTRDRCDIVERPREITGHTAGMFADDLPDHG